VVSGDVPTDSTVDADLPMDALRSWELTALVGEDKSNVLDVTIADAAQSVTKRITMHSQYVEPPITPPAWTDEPWAATDAGFPQGALLEVSVFITFKTDGTATLFMQTHAMPLTQFEVDDWFDTPPPLTEDLNDYDIMVDPSGAGQESGDFNTPLRMTEERTFTLGYATFPQAPEGQPAKAPREFTFYASVRANGAAWVTKPVVITVIRSDGTFP